MALRIISKFQRFFINRIVSNLLPLHLTNGQLSRELPNIQFKPKTLNNIPMLASTLNFFLCQKIQALLGFQGKNILDKKWKDISEIQRMNI